MPEYANSVMKALINEYIHSERDRKILTRRFCDGVKYERLAAEFGLSRNQICNIVRQGRAVLTPLLEQQNQD